MQYSGEVPDIAQASSMVVPLHRKKPLFTGKRLEEICPAENCIVAKLRGKSSKAGFFGKKGLPQKPILSRSRNSYKLVQQHHHHRLIYHVMPREVI